MSFYRDKAESKLRSLEESKEFALRQIARLGPLECGIWELHLNGLNEQIELYNLLNEQVEQLMNKEETGDFK